MLAFFFDHVLDLLVAHIGYVDRLIVHPQRVQNELGTLLVTSNLLGCEKKAISLN